MSLRVAGLFGLLMLVALPVQAQVVLQGTVLDARTGEPLAAAHVQVEDQPRGTITNTLGRFTLQVPALPVTFTVRYVGYRTARIVAAPDDTLDYRVALEPAVIPLGEVVVTGEDLAESIMRRVIARKQAWRQRLGAYAAQGYTKLVLENGSQIVYLSESVFDVYHDPERGPREVVRSQRRTSDLHAAFGLHPAGYVPDLYDDVIDVQGLPLVGPTHPEALDYYTFSIAGRRMLDDRIVYDLYVAPKTTVHPTFIGRIAVLDEEYALLEAELRPARHVAFAPPIARYAVVYRQQFARFGDGFWLPVDLRLDGVIQVAQANQTYPEATFQQVSRLSDYRLGGPLPEAPFATAVRVTVDEASVLEDYLFLAGRHILPLTPREAEALERLRRAPPLTLEAAFAPRGRPPGVAAFEAARYADDRPQFTWPRLLQGFTPWVWYNRVDGYALGFARYVDVAPHFFGELRLAEVNGASASGGPKLRMKARGQYRWGRGGLAELGYEANSDRRGVGSLYPVPITSLPGHLGWGDYFDYFWNRRFHARTGYRMARVRLTGGLHVEQHRSLERSRTRAWPFDDMLRPNPPVDDGALRSVSVEAAYGDGFKPFRAGALRRVGLEAEFGLPTMGGDFRFGRYRAELDWRFRTFYRNRLQSQTLDVRAFAGTATGALPVQRIGLLDGTLGPFATFGAFRARRDRPYEGDRYAGAFWEYDLTTLPFEWLGLRPLVVRRMGILLHGGHGRTWLGDAWHSDLAFTPQVPDAWHHEAGVSLTYLMGFPVRLDFTWRLDRPGFFVGFGLMRF